MKIKLSQWLRLAQSKGDKGIADKNALPLRWNLRPVKSLFGMTSMEDG